MILVSYNPTITYKLCKDCRHFKPSLCKNIKFGHCTKEGKIDLVDGTITYSYVEVARITCEGKWWEPLKN